MGGYQEKQIGENTMEVKFYGNQHTSKEKVSRFLLYRCAEITEKSGFDFFVVLKDQSYEKELINSPTIDQPFKTVESKSVGVRTVVSPDLTMDTISKSSVGVYIIGMFKEGSKDYADYKKSHIKARRILKDYKNYIK
jgi:hypothetical protein|tara:strand:- start:526 stop:936 length:411 start_codon:yes stop_codon:yes gene_type:complete